MGFGDILGAAAPVIGSFFGPAGTAVGGMIGGMISGGGGAEAGAMSEEMYQAMLDQLALQNAYATRAQGYFEDQFAQEPYYLEYLMKLNAQRDAYARDLQQYSRSWQEMERAMRLGDQAYSRYRLDAGDQAAASERARQLEEIAYNRNVDEETRRRAFEELDYAKQVAAGERQFDIDRWRMEREFEIEQMQRVQQMLEEERSYMQARQEDVLRKTGVLGEDMARKYESFGDLVPARRFTEQDVASTEQQFLDQYMSDADRAVDRMASITEGDLINRGVDISTTGDVTRGQLLREQAAPLYMQARNKARQDALSYVGGLQSTLFTGENQEIARRAKLLEEMQSAYMPALQMANAVTAPPSAAADLFRQIGQTQIGSAGGYQMPLGMPDIFRSGDANLGLVEQWANPVQSFGTTWSPSPGYENQMFNPLQYWTSPTTFLEAARPPAFDGSYAGSSLGTHAANQMEGMGSLAKDFATAGGFSSLLSGVKDFFGGNNGGWGTTTGIIAGL